MKNPEWKWIVEPELAFTKIYHNSKRIYESVQICIIAINGIPYAIDKGTRIDGWTIPIFIDMFFDLIRELWPPFVHDELYKKAGLYPKITRKIADQLLRDIALDRGCQKREVMIAYWAVRTFSGPIWKKYKKHNLKRINLPSRSE